MARWYSTLFALTTMTFSAVVVAGCLAEVPDEGDDPVAEPVGEAQEKAIIECLWCSTGPSPPKGQCTEYDCGGSSGVHYYTCCNNCDEGPTPPGDGTEFDGASNGNYCGACGANLGGGCVNRAPFKCGGSAGELACKKYCDKGAITFPGACWNWTLCFSYCCKDGDPSDGVDGWIPICIKSQEDAAKLESIPAQVAEDEAAAAAEAPIDASP